MYFDFKTWAKQNESIEPDFLNVGAQEQTASGGTLPPKWKIDTGNRKVRTYRFETSNDMMDFLQSLSSEFDARKYKPEMKIKSKKLLVYLGKVNEITNRDIAIAKMMDRKYSVYNLDAADRDRQPDETDFTTKGDKK